MWIVKILGFCAVSGAGAYLGYNRSARYKKREKALGEILRFCDCLINDITYLQLPVTEMLKGRIETFSSLNSIIQEYLLLLNTRRNIDRDTLISCIPKCNLNDDEYVLMIQLLDTLGKSDSSTQRNAIISLKDAFEVKYNFALEENKKYGNLYFKLGILGGLAIGIVVL